jgi:formyltetrahydrofolate deformylase
MAAARQSARLLATCPDRHGIIAALSGFLHEIGANIVTSDQYSTDPEDGTLFLRMEIHLDGLPERRDELETAFAEVAEPFGMTWRFAYPDAAKRVVLFTSRHDHCVLDLLWRWRRGELACDIVGVVSNHADLYRDVAAFGVPYHHIPMPRDGKADAERRILDTLGDDVDLVVLARYMQVLGESIVARFAGRVINIHHSFLPAFAGARPYHNAHERGVKIIGATAHYVTPELDQGPIIEQDVVRVSHRDSVADLIRKGRDLEKTVLARAVDLHLRNRVVVYGNKTVVFD